MKVGAVSLAQESSVGISKTEIFFSVFADGKLSVTGSALIDEVIFLRKASSTAVLLPGSAMTMTFSAMAIFLITLEKAFCAFSGLTPQLPGRTGQIIIVPSCSENSAGM